MAQPIELYFWPTPNGYKINLALREMGLPYDLKTVNIGRGEQFTPEFQALSPNGRMPAILDPEGPDAKPISIFESGAILQYLARKTGNRFYGDDERTRTEVDQWLFWQMAGLGPMAGQANHFRNYAPTMTTDQRHLAYGVNRYTNEVHRLYGVMEGRLQDRDYLAGDYSIADMACFPWSRYPGSRGIDLAEFPSVKVWVERIDARPAVKAAYEEGEVVRKGAANLADPGKDADEQRRILFGQRARR